MINTASKESGDPIYEVNKFHFTLHAKIISFVTFKICNSLSNMFSCTFNLGFDLELALSIRYMSIFKDDMLTYLM